MIAYKMRYYRADITRSLVVYVEVVEKFLKSFPFQCIIGPDRKYIHESLLIFSVFCALRFKDKQNMILI